MSAMTLTATKTSDWLWGLFGCSLMAAYWPGIAGAATTPRWDVAAALAVVFFITPRARMTAIHWLGIFVLGWLALTLLWDRGDALLDGVNEAYQLGIVAVAFAVGSSARDLRPFIFGCAVGIGINSGVAIAQWFGWHDLPFFYGSLGGLFYNPDRLAAAAAMVAVAVLAERRSWWSLPIIAPSLVLTHSSAAWLALAVGVFILAGQLPRGFARTIRLAMIAAGCAAVAVKLGTSSTDERIAIVRDTIPQLSFWGNGLGSFREGFLAHAQSYDFARFQSRPEHPHNEWLWLAYEGGAPAVFLSTLFAVAVARCARRTFIPILAAFGVLALFAFPLHDAATAVMAAVVAGHCVAGRVRYGVGNVDRGLSLQPVVASDADATEHGPFDDRAKVVSVPAAVS